MKFANHPQPAKVRRVPFAFIPLADFGLEPAAALLDRGFSDYLVKLRFSAAGLLQSARTDSVDLTASRVVLRDGVPVGVGLVARRGWTSRLAGMAVVPEARRGSVGRALMAHLLADARARGDRAMELEVIEQNPPAVRLYAAYGFQRVRRLVGGAGHPVGNARAAIAEITPIDVRELSRLIVRAGYPDLPWQISAETVAQMEPAAAAFCAGPTGVLLLLPSETAVVLRAVAVGTTPEAGAALLALLRALADRFSGREWRATAYFPEPLGAVLEQFGLARTPLTQWQMTRTLD